MIAYRQELSDKMLTHSSSQDSVLMGSLLRYTFTKECFEEINQSINQSWRPQPSSTPGTPVLLVGHTDLRKELD